MKCNNCIKSSAHLDTSCNWFARCDLLGTAQMVGNCCNGDGESMCNCSNQEPPDWDCDLGRDHQYCIHHAD
jgi:hypothetical protein